MRGSDRNPATVVMSASPVKIIAVSYYTVYKTEDHFRPELVFVVCGSEREHRESDMNPFRVGQQEILQE